MSGLRVRLGFASASAAAAALSVAALVPLFLVIGGRPQDSLSILSIDVLFVSAVAFLVAHHIAPRRTGEEATGAAVRVAFVIWSLLWVCVIGLTLGTTVVTVWNGTDPIGAVGLLLYAAAYQLLFTPILLLALVVQLAIAANLWRRVHRRHPRGILPPGSTPRDRQAGDAMTRRTGARAALVVASPVALGTMGIGLLAAVVIPGPYGAPVSPAIWIGGAIAGATAATAVVLGALWAGHTSRLAVISMGVVAVPVGAYALWLLGVVGDHLFGAQPTSDLGTAVTAGSIGVILFGVPASIVTISHAFAWRAMARRWTLEAPR